VASDAEEPGECAVSEALVYLLAETSGRAFKIGVSIAPSRRAVALPQTIDRKRSLQIPMTAGAAYQVERVLHYLFRDHAAEMPEGDGYTEWFEMAAWPDVLNFLTEQRERLGVGEPEPIPEPSSAPLPAVRIDPAVVGARRLRADEKKREAVRRAEEQRVIAIKHNKQVVEWLRGFVSEIAAAGAIKGVLLYNNVRCGWESELAAELFLSGNHDDMDRWAEDVVAWHPSKRLLDGDGFGGRPIFSSVYFSQGRRRSFAAIDLLPEFLNVPAGLAEQVPFASEVQEVLSPWVARVGKRLGPQLMRFHRLMAAGKASMAEDFEAAFG
jgi:hypothetical protein